MRKKLVLAYPNLKWKKFDFHTSWDLNPSILCLLGKMVEEDVDVKIIDAQFYDLSLKEFVRQVMEYGADYIGISMLTSEYQEILHLAAADLKAAKSDIVIIAGGVHVTMEYKTIMEDVNIDYAVRGEGEFTLQQLIRHLNGDGPLPITGLVYREANKLIETTQEWIEDLAVLPVPNYDLVKMEDYIHVGARYGPARAPEFPSVRMIATRGCPVGCSFCQVESISGFKVRTRTPKQIVDELMMLKEKYGIKSVLFDDDNIAIKKKFFKTLMREFIDRNLELKFLLNNFAIFALDDEMRDLIVEAGCVGINIAIESGNQRVMDDIVTKPLDLGKVPGLIKGVQDHGLFVIANFIIGFPGETWEEIRETAQFAETCGADYVKFFIAMPLKDTKMLEMAKHLDALDVKEDDLEVNWRFSQIKSDEWTSNDISILRAYEWDRINFGTPERREKMTKLWGLNDAELADIRKKTRDAVTISDDANNMVVN